MIASMMPQTYVTKYKYDTWDRLQEIVIKSIYYGSNNRKIALNLLFFEVTKYIDNKITGDP